MITVVLDTNQFVSALISAHGAPKKIFQAWRQGKIIILASQNILVEIQRVLLYPKIQKLHQLKKEKVEEFIEQLREQCLMLPDNLDLEVIKEDPSDDKFLACALTGGAEYIISGDKHLLNLRECQGVKIISPSTFLKILSSCFPQND